MHTRLSQAEGRRRHENAVAERLSDAKFRTDIHLQKDVYFTDIHLQKDVSTYRKMYTLQISTYRKMYPPTERCILVY